MKKLILIFFVVFFNYVHAQINPDEEQLGAWYMYFFQKNFKNSPFGIQGDYQFRFWNMGTDLEQILLRTGATYKPENANILFTQGYALIITGQPGEEVNNIVENRIYQEALLPQTIGSRFLITHRFRFEQRWVEDQNFRTRFRYNIFLNIPLNARKLAKNIIYLALYNEIFINGQRDIGNDRQVGYFDRNRTYLGIGYGLLDNLRLQTGWMKQTTANWSKGQLQFSLHHSF